MTEEKLVPDSMTRKALKDQLEKLDNEVKALEERRRALYLKQNEVQRKYYPMLGSKEVGKCYKEVEGRGDEHSIRRTYYYRILKVQSFREFWAECMAVEETGYGSKRRYHFSVDTVHSPFLSMNKISPEEYKKVKQTILEEIGKGLKVIKK